MAKLIREEFIKQFECETIKGLTQEVLQELCNHELVLEDKIIPKLKKKHPKASEKQIKAWARACIRKKIMIDLKR